MYKKRMRRSTAAVTLTLIGSAALHGCGDSSPRARDIYANKADCVREWVNESRCESGGSHGSGSYYYGPSYTPSGNPSNGMQAPLGKHSKAVASNVTRSGFGSTSSFHSSGGGGG